MREEVSPGILKRIKQLESATKQSLPTGGVPNFSVPVKPTGLGHQTASIPAQPIEQIKPQPSGGLAAIKSKIKQFADFTHSGPKPGGSKAGGIFSKKGKGWLIKGGAGYGTLAAKTTFP